jgi:hypothetical protein
MQDDPQARYEQVVADLIDRGAQSGKMFGMPCLKIEGKAFAGYFDGDMVFKLRSPEHARASALPGAHLFDPSGRGRPMKEWVQVPGTASQEWLELARSAQRTVQGGE